MATKKHTLTAQKDHLTGGKGGDLFLGAQGTLGSNDVLDGGKGVDVISAVIAGSNLAPVMTSIEKGIFTHQGHAKVGLDLAMAQAMTDVTFNAIAANVTLGHADHVARVNFSHDNNHLVSLEGMNANITPVVHLVFSESSNESVNLATVTNVAFQALDVSLRESKGVTLGTTIGADALTIHSYGKTANSIDIVTPSLATGLDSLTATGPAALQVVTSQTSGMQNLATFDGTKMSGAISADFSSVHLTSILCGSGNDRISIGNIGGTSVLESKVDLGSGNDVLDLTSTVFDPSAVSMDGGEGSDTLVLSGDPVSWQTAVSHFETLSLLDVGGIYKLDSQWKTLKIAGHSGGSTDVFVDGGSALTSILGDSGMNYLTLTELGGTAANKAVVSLGGDADFLVLRNMVPDFHTQIFRGGADRDEVVVEGNVSHLATMFQGFEGLQVQDAAGTYSLAGSDFDTFGLSGNAMVSSVTVNNVNSGSALTLLDSVANFIAVNLVNAATNHNDLLNVNLYSGVTLGTSNFGLFAHDVSKLDIQCYNGISVLYLSAVGGTTESATVEIYGNTKLTMIATTGSVSNIDAIVIDNDAGVDITGLANGAQAFSSAGAIIAGGDGSDGLVGGIGKDTIAGGAGDDTIHGSLGKDAIDVSGGGQDMLIFHTKDQSGFFDGDTVAGFNIFTGIDISDIVSSVTFGGNKALFDDGLDLLSTSHSVAFFDTTSHTLYVDVNHDGALTIGQDMEFKLTGLDSFSGSSLIG